MKTIKTLDIPSAAGIDFNSGDVRHVGAKSSLDSVSISFATRCLAERDNLIRNRLNEVIASLNNYETPVYIPVLRTRVRTGGTEQVSNYRIPSGYEARVNNVSVDSIPANSVRVEILYSSSTFGSSSGTSVVSTATEFVGNTTFFGEGEFIIRLTNISDRDSEVVASISISVRSKIAERSQLSTTETVTVAGAVGPTGPVGPKGASGDPGPRGYQGNPGDAGPTGPSGPTGATGYTGYTGAPGVGSSPTFSEASVPGTLVASTGFVAGSPYLDYVGSGVVGGTYYVPMTETRVEVGTEGVNFLSLTYHAMFKGTVLFKVPTKAWGSDRDWDVNSTACVAVAGSLTGVSTVQPLVSKLDSTQWQIDVPAGSPQAVSVTVSGVGLR